MSSRRHRVTEVDAQELVSSWRASRRALPAWCASQGIDGRSLRYWAARLDRLPVRFVDVTPVPVPSPRPGLRLLVGDVTVELSDEFVAETLARALAVVRGC
jgi:hypothetical protein